MVVVAPSSGRASSFHHHHHHQQQQQRASPAHDPMFPLVAAAHRALETTTNANANAKPASAPGPTIHFWQQAAADGASPPSPSPGKKPRGGGGGGGRADSGGSGSIGGTTSCYDCGNQAKKGCAHSRCRTCCNSRGFECDTHVKSTWVPAARRRERHQQQLAGAGASPPPPYLAKKPRLACQTNNNNTGGGTNSRTSTSNATTPRSFETSSSHHHNHQDASFRESLPRHVRGPAVFRCVQMTSVDDGHREVAYQAAVTINGHLFRGLLYDLGAEDEGRAAHLGSSDLHLGSASAAAAPDLYNSGGGGPLILGGLGYGNTS